MPQSAAELALITRILIYPVQSLSGDLVRSTPPRSVTQAEATTAFPG